MVFKFLRPKTQGVRAASTDGRVVYAIGDVHGQLELLDQLLDLIARDFVALGRTDRPVLIFVGDYVDRGPMSKGVIDRLIALKRASVEGGPFELRTLMGNHEQTMLSFLENPDAGPAWAEFGGGDTLVSYGVARPAPRGDQEAWLQTQVDFQRNLPSTHLAFLRQLELSAIYGGYLFVHAGVRPGVPLDRQDPEDMMWIRGDFLSQPHRLNYVVVHGHTPDEQPFLGPDRINIDTGAYATGVLTAVRLTEGPPTVLQARKSGQT
jgi:serine/threonine protein phosphatase 1